MNDDERERTGESVDRAARTAEGDRATEAEGGRVGSGLRPTRRGMLRGTAAATTIAAFGGIAVGQEEGETLDPAETIVLGGRVEGWQGRDPARIDGAVNPTLNLQAGQAYDLTWINVDGLPHNFVILDQEGSVLQRTEIIDEQGAEQSVTIAASEQMAVYLCEVHPTSMRGEIAIGGLEEQAVPEPTKAAVPPGPTVGLQRVAGDPLTQPVAMEVATVEGTERQYIVDQTGEIYLRTEGGLREFLDLSPRIVIDDEGFDERGLLGMATHPNFEENRRFYVRYSSQPVQEELPEGYDHMFILSEFQANESFTQADPASERILMEIPEPQFNHNAGDIDFGPDGMLYVTTGDGGGADDTGVGHVNDWYEVNRGGNGQDVTENLLGSILRIDVDAREGDLPYGIPSDNPLVGTEGLDEHWAWGFRNPWRFSFNNGQLVVADVGQNLFEEIDIVEKGGNYGWNVREGFHCFSTENPGEIDAITECPTQAPDVEPYGGQPLVDPVLVYPHSVDGQTVGISVTGGYVYQGGQLQTLTNQYVFGDWSASFGTPAGRLWVADLPELNLEGAPAGARADGNATAGNATDAGNVTVGNETEAANVTAGNETADGGVEGNLTVDEEVEGNLTVENVSVGNETAAANATAGNETTDEVTVGNETGNVTADNETETGNVTVDDQAGNVTAGNETGNVTAGNETGNVTAGNETGQDGQPGAAQFPMRELVVANSPNGEINRTVLAFGRDTQGELYVLTSTTTTVDGTGEVFRFVPPEQGDEIQPPQGQGGQQG